MFQKPGTNGPGTGPLTGHLPVDILPGDRDPQASRRLAVHQELSATRRELDELRSLVDTLPEIFERKFEERLAPMLTQRQRLLEQTGALRQQMHQLQGTATDGQIRPRLAGSGGGASLAQTLRHAFGLEARRSA
ncbi:hypothetical protein CPCC7001_2267 [Cyanobium sp. PCC 7001]|uniref:hypothetical protein n=1 Tax=Cyanobium sp. PCC 7001 TaxID=180281 RepID=UPI0001805D5F|nr:hypothetical protein [Cyanobium sp. PCC 7001]EDY39386.1 hypothetical protein CPCC7001_2267 [Cyanobium sp. PCC 7001]